MPVVRESLSIQDKMQAISVCGHEFVTPDIHRIAKHRNGIATGLQQLDQMMDIVKVGARRFSFLDFYCICDLIFMSS